MRNKKGFLSWPAVLLLVVWAGCQTIPPSGEGPVAGSGVRGTIVMKGTGEPVEGANVYAYTDYSKNLIGVADYVSKGSAPDGSYTVTIPPGEYYMVARKRISGANYGPIVTGDLYDHRFEQEVLRVEPGQFLERDFQLARLSEPMFFQVFTEAQRQTTTGIRGRILDLNGVPVQGAFATAYRNSDMRRLPDFASTLSGDDGRFTLYLPSGGTWYVGARSHARAVPETGEPVGRYNGTEDHSVAVRDDSFVEGIEIILRPFASKVPEGYTPY